MTDIIIWLLIGFSVPIVAWLATNLAVKIIVSTLRKRNEN